MRACLYGLALLFASHLHHGANLFQACAVSESNRGNGIAQYLSLDDPPPNGLLAGQHHHIGRRLDEYVTSHLDGRCVPLTVPDLLCHLFSMCDERPLQSSRRWQECRIVRHQESLLRPGQEVSSRYEQGLFSKRAILRSADRLRNAKRSAKEGCMGSIWRSCF